MRKKNLKSKTEYLQTIRHKIVLEHNQQTKLRGFATHFESRAKINKNVCGSNPNEKRKAEKPDGLD